MLKIIASTNQNRLGADALRIPYAVALGEDLLPGEPLSKRQLMQLTFYDYEPFERAIDAMRNSGSEVISEETVETVSDLLDLPYVDESTIKNFGMLLAYLYLEDVIDPIANFVETHGGVKSDKVFNVGGRRLVDGLIEAAPPGCNATLLLQRCTFPHPETLRSVTLSAYFVVKCEVSVSVATYNART